MQSQLTTSMQCKEYDDNNGGASIRVRRANAIKSLRSSSGTSNKRTMGAAVEGRLISIYWILMLLCSHLACYLSLFKHHHHRYQQHHHLWRLLSDCGRLLLQIVLPHRVILLLTFSHNMYVASFPHNMYQVFHTIASTKFSTQQQSLHIIPASTASRAVSLVQLFQTISSISVFSANATLCISPNCAFHCIALRVWEDLHARRAGCHATAASSSGNGASPLLSPAPIPNPFSSYSLHFLLSNKYFHPIPALHPSSCKTLCKRRQPLASCSYLDLFQVPFYSR